MKKLNNKGVTLVALIVTIIILIILASITITSLIGDNGLLQKTKQGKEKHQQAEKKEQRYILETNEDLTDMELSLKSEDVESKLVENAMNLKN